MDELDRRIVNHLQGGFPLCERPFEAAAQALGTTEDDLLSRLKTLLEHNVLSRFGPMFDAERLGGAFCLCAMRVPPADFGRVAEMVNSHAEVAHNYERTHPLNMWFVVAARDPVHIARVVSAVELETGYPVLCLPREAEYFVELRLSA